MNNFQLNKLLFSSKYRIWRHVVFWIVYTVIVAFTWHKGDRGFDQYLFQGLVWLPARIIYCYPLIFWVLPEFLLKEKYIKFACIILMWAVAGWFFNYLFRFYLFIPIMNYFQLDRINRDPWQPNSFLVLTTTAGITSVIVLFKHWVKKQQEWVQAEKEKVTAELQLLKAQVHPHFLFNTLNNIYSFSLAQSPKTPELILKLSSLLSYMLYDCKAEEVLLEKEIEVMKNYIDLEKERYGNKIEISINIEGDIEDKYIAPLLILPFLENAFKHGTSEQLEKPWMSVDLLVKQHVLTCKLANSKNEFVPDNHNGIGIQNIKKRLQYLYPDKHKLKMNDEGNFFVVSVLIELMNNKMEHPNSLLISLPVAENASP